MLYLKVFFLSLPYTVTFSGQQQFVTVPPSSPCHSRRYMLLSMCRLAHTMIAQRALNDDAEARDGRGEDGARFTTKLGVKIHIVPKDLNIPSNKTRPSSTYSFFPFWPSIFDIGKFIPSSPGSSQQKNTSIQQQSAATPQ